MAALLLCQVLPGLNAEGAPCRLTGPAGSLRSGRRCCLSLYRRDVSGTTAVWASCGPEQKTRASCLPSSFPSLPAPPARPSTALADPLHSSCPQIARACLSSWEPWPEWGMSRITRGDEGSLRSGGSPGSSGDSAGEADVFPGASSRVLAFLSLTLSPHLPPPPALALVPPLTRWSPLLPSSPTRALPILPWGQTFPLHLPLQTVDAY